MRACGCVRACVRAGVCQLLAEGLGICPVLALILLAVAHPQPNVMPEVAVILAGGASVLLVEIIEVALVVQRSRFRLES